VSLRYHRASRTARERQAEMPGCAGGNDVGIEASIEPASVGESGHKHSRLAFGLIPLYLRLLKVVRHLAPNAAEIHLHLFGTIQRRLYMRQHVLTPQLLNEF
jgi:hypothetical protein